MPTTRLDTADAAARRDRLAPQLTARLLPAPAALCCLAARWAVGECFQNAAHSHDTSPSTY